MPAIAQLSPTPPRAVHSFAEAGRFIWEAGSSVALQPLCRFLPRGDDHAVMTLPGFMGADGSMASIRKFLARQGYQALPWGLGRNVPDSGELSLESVLEYRQQVEATLVEKLSRQVKKRGGGRVSLIGWSLGGLYATGMAHRYPDLIRQVITLGTPFGDPRGTALYGPMARRFEGHMDSAARDHWNGLTFDGKLEVPVTAVYSRSDGIVGEDIARLPEHPFMENIAVMASHVGFPFNPLVRLVMAERLSQADGQWQPYSSLTMGRLLEVPAH